MDVSSLTEDSDITKAFQVWSSYMTKVPEKNDSVYIFTIVDSLKKVLAALEHLVVAKTKG
jgi:predicted transcriptional regulator